MYGATEIARPDIARPSKLWGLTSRDWTTWHHVTRVDNARPDNVAPSIAGVDILKLALMCEYLLTAFFVAWDIIL